MSIIIILLAGVNSIFAFSWLLHGCQKDFMNNRDQIAFLRNLKKTDIDGKNIKVEIFNACGVSNAARKLTDYLREKNVDVVFYDNFIVNNRLHKISNTIVIDRKKKNRANAQRIARLINSKSKYVIHQDSPEREVDVTILIGQDYKDLVPFRD